MRANTCYFKFNILFLCLRVVHKGKHTIHTILREFVMDRPETSFGTKVDCSSYHPFQQRQRRVATTVCFDKGEVDANVMDTGLQIVSFVWRVVHKG